MGSGSLPVYATPAMISLIEQSAVNLLAGKLEEGQTTVGTNLNVHVSQHQLVERSNVIVHNRDRPQTSGIPCK